MNKTQKNQLARKIAKEFKRKIILLDQSISYASPVFHTIHDLSRWKNDRDALILQFQELCQNHEIRRI